MKRTQTIVSAHRASRGFTLIEVMISVLVLGFGLLGFALLQTMSVRFSQSANHRTQATNLSYELLDQMRGNRVLWRSYLGNYAAPANTGTACKMSAAQVTPLMYRNYWQCQLGDMLGDGATAVVQELNGAVRVSITWGDERWNDADKDGVVSAGESNRTFSVESRL